MSQSGLTLDVIANDSDQVERLTALDALRFLLTPPEVDWEQWTLTLETLIPQTTPQDAK